MKERKQQEPLSRMIQGTNWRTSWLGGMFGNSDKNHDNPDSSNNDPTLYLAYLSSIDLNHKKNISYSMQYLDLMKSGQPVAGLDFFYEPFEYGKIWDNHFMVPLSVKIVNSTSRRLYFEEIRVTVKESIIDTDPVLVVKDDLFHIGSFKIFNFGWGKAMDCKLRFHITTLSSGYGSGEWQEPTKGKCFVRNLGTLESEYELSIGEFVPANLDISKCKWHAVTGANLIMVSVFGKLSYRTESGSSREFRFLTRVNLIPPGPGAPAKPSYECDIILTAGLSGTFTFPLDQQIASNESDHWLLKVSTDKSASFDVLMEFVTVDGHAIGKSLFFSIFQPRSVYAKKYKPSKCLRIPSSIYSDPLGPNLTEKIQFISYDQLSDETQVLIYIQLTEQQKEWLNKEETDVLQKFLVSWTQTTRFDKGMFFVYKHDGWRSHAYWFYCSSYYSNLFNQAELVQSEGKEFMKRKLFKDAIAKFKTSVSKFDHWRFVVQSTKRQPRVQKSNLLIFVINVNKHYANHFAGFAKYL